jgi:hypothetical protein
MVNSKREVSEHMTFGYLIKQAGFNPERFQKIAEIPLTIYDCKNRIVEDELNFVKPILDCNWSSKLNFENLIESMSIDESKIPKKISARLTEDILALYFEGQNSPKFFWRF